MYTGGTTEETLEGH